MTDTQWPRYEVFEQVSEDQPHQNTNSIHAPDGEMALMNARDVFVRRPYCVSMWVVPADKIFSKTAQELADPDWATNSEIESVSTSTEPYYVFQKLKHRGSQTYIGIVEAQSPIEALQHALAVYSEGNPLAWWVFPARFVTKSEPDDIESMFDPSLDKTFRDQSEYHTIAMMYEIKKRARQAEDSE